MNVHMLKNFEQENNCKIIYLTEYGSRLYGTNNPKSDTDYKGIFIPNSTDVLLKRDLEHWTSNSNNTNEKNGAEDIDLQLFSIYKFFNLIQKGETGALDILFSMFRNDTIVYADDIYVRVLKEQYKELLNRNLQSFVGYCVGQSKKYGIKGASYKEWNDFNGHWQEMRKDIDLSRKLGDGFEILKLIVKDYKYIKFIVAPGPRSSGSYEDIEYIEILGKKFSGDVTMQYFLTKLDKMGDEFGNRTKAAAEGVDWKAMSHAVRVISEVEELLDTGFITFPLLNKTYIKSIKDGNEDIENVMDYINEKLDVVNGKMLASELPEKSNQKLIDELTLLWVKEK